MKVKLFEFAFVSLSPHGWRSPTLTNMEKSVSYFTLRLGQKFPSSIPFSLRPPLP